MWVPAGSAFAAKGPASAKAARWECSQGVWGTVGTSAAGAEKEGREGQASRSERGGEGRQGAPGLGGHWEDSGSSSEHLRSQCRPWRGDTADLF